MALNDLLSMSALDFERLRDKSNGVLHVAVHPAWNVFFDTTFAKASDGGDLLRLYVDECIDSIIKAMAEIRRFYGSTPFSPLENLNTGNVPKVKKPSLSERKTYNYHNLLIEFLKAYEVLKETAYLVRLREEQQPCVLVLTKGLPISSNYPASYQLHLDFVTGDATTFFSIESEDYKENDRFGYLHKPFVKRGSIVTRDDVVDESKLIALERLYRAIGASEVRLFGSNVNQCLGGTEESLRLCELDGVVTVMLDASVSFPSKIGLALRGRGRLGKDTYLKLLQLFNEHLQEPETDFSKLKDAVGRGPLEQLSFFESYGRIVHLINEIKRLTAYVHTR